MSYYPPVSFQFTVRIAGSKAAVDTGFQEVSGLDAEREVVELKEGGENRFVHKLPGAVKASNLTLKRGMVLASSPFFTWLKDTFESDLSRPVKPKSITVSLLDQKQKPLMTWNVVNAWPVKWQIGSLDATQNQIAMETVELAYDRVVRKVERTLTATGTFAP
ncbi:phage tail protein [uncultured Roseobacter sp.]|uniref:phage tail protein n=1 Tax=uncultured Roseobacter sp. TaxID=114847 RepID=UPI002620E9EA|nr:phage tail protein [uncultured Roseobacter sp.]